MGSNGRTVCESIIFFEVYSLMIFANKKVLLFSYCNYIFISIFSDHFSLISPFHDHLG